MAPLQVPGGPELLVVLVALVLNAIILIGILGGLGYFLLRIRSGGSVDERLDRIERKIGRLEAQVEHLEATTGVERAGGSGDADADDRETQ